MKGYGEAWQFSVFYCVLRDIDRARMEADLQREMNQKLDQALIVDLGADEAAARDAATAIGQPIDHGDGGMVVV